MVVQHPLFLQVMFLSVFVSGNFALQSQVYHHVVNFAELQSALKDSLVEFRFLPLPVALQGKNAIHISQTLAKQALGQTQSHFSKRIESSCFGVSCFIQNNKFTIGILDSSWRFSSWTFSNNSGQISQQIIACLRHIATNGAAPTPQNYTSTFIQPALQLTHADVVQVCYLPTGHALVNPTFSSPAIIVPGSFNPLHEGHLTLASQAQRKFPHMRLFFELSIANADKGGLANFQSRVDQFSTHSHAVICTKASLFVSKAQLFPGSVFVLGADTVVRLVDLKYYGQSREEMLISLARIIVEYKCSFLVAGRLVVQSDGVRVFTTCQSEVETALPASLTSAFTFLTEEEFRIDLSSTELRNRSAAAMAATESVKE